MENGDNDRCVFPLTGLQIGDLQSYLSHLSLFMTTNGGTFYVLVDNRPWLEDPGSRHTHLWQLMVTKSRLSPFAITRGRRDKKMVGEPSELRASSSSNTRKLSNVKKWLSLIDAVMLSRKRALLPVKKLRNSLIANSKLHRTLYGFIVFEVSWSNVRGINYLNELQTDTSLAIESKVMRRWEFDSISQAAKLISSWFPGTTDERTLLEEHLYATIGLNVVAGEKFYDAPETFPWAGNDPDDIFSFEDESPCSPSNKFRVFPVTTGDKMNGLSTPPPADCPYRRRKLMASISHEIGISSKEAVEMLSCTPGLSDCKVSPEPILYRDVLILFRFKDPDLPFKLKDIITSDLRLLTLLEAGLPSWVIFLQSYPVFCYLYRPWMCPLARALYVLISIITVLIGFYDLYKNVPLLKATASSLLGPLFDWVEKLEMISRIKYLGTMLFLHNFQKAIKWFLMVTQTTRTCLSFIIDPMTGPVAEFLEFFLPFWNMFVRIVESFFSVTWMVIESSFTMAGNGIEILLLPLWYILVLAWNIATGIIYPIFWLLWEVFYAPVRLVLGICSLVAYMCNLVYELAGGLLLFASSIINFTGDVKSTVSSYEVSIWRSLWNDLFSQPFRALRSILNGFVAFFAACNRHRLSIYNYIEEFYKRLSGATRRGNSEKHNQIGQTSEAQLPPSARKRLPRPAKSRKNN